MDYHLKFDVKIDKLDEVDDTPFTLACTRGYGSDEIDFIDLNNGVEITNRYKICSSLYDAGAVLPTEYLVARGGNTPLHWCIYHGDFACSLLVYNMNPGQIYLPNTND